ncbi:MAG: hypothetical protein FGF51_00270 [Candidatus Brockarchaeota archaeon]|nr:hypothetical protein [Candidatus Brockarchaeota archaeon]
MPLPLSLSKLACGETLIILLHKLHIVHPIPVLPSVIVMTLAATDTRITRVRNLVVTYYSAPPVGVCGSQPLRMFKRNIVFLMR